jgi:hypothetical protein
MAIASAALLAWAGSAGAATVLASGTGPDGHHYLVGAGSAISWNDALGEVTASFPDYHLATITTRRENRFVASLTDGLGFQFWIGGSQRPSEPEPNPSAGWSWITGEPWKYTNWNGGEPNDAQGIEDFAAIYAGSGFWNDEGSAPGLISGYVAEIAPIPVPVVFPAFILALCILGGVARKRRLA